MRDQIVRFLNQHPSVLGLVFALIGGWELWHALFRYEQRKKHIESLIQRRHWSVFLGLRKAHPRPLSIAGSIFMLTAGLAMIDLEIGLLDRRLLMSALAIAMFYFFAVFIRVKWQSRKENK